MGKAAHGDGGERLGFHGRGATPREGGDWGRSYGFSVRVVGFAEGGSGKERLNRVRVFPFFFFCFYTFFFSYRTCIYMSHFMSISIFIVFLLLLFIWFIK